MLFLFSLFLQKIEFKITDDDEEQIKMKRKKYFFLFFQILSRPDVAESRPELNTNKKFLNGNKKRLSLYLRLFPRRIQHKLSIQDTHTHTHASIL